MLGWLVRMAVLVATTTAASVAQAGTLEATAAPVQRPRAMVAAPPVAAAPVAVVPVATSAAADPTAAEPPQPEPPQPAPTQGAAAQAAAPAATPREIPAASPPAPRPTSDTTAIGVHREAAPAKKKFSHDGFTTDLRVGTLGCLRGLCSGGHNVRPGFRIDGFLGGNIRGFVDFGIAGGWGSMTSNVTPGTNVLSLYGLDPVLLQQALGLLGGKALGIDLPSLTVNDSKLRTAQAGPLLRVHFIPRGRFLAYVGSGVQYNLFRASYATAGGDVRLDFHGIAVPVEAGFGVQVHEHVTVGLQFDYLWTWYALANLKQGSQTVTAPLRILDQAAKMQNADSVRGQLPQFWTLGLMLRARI